MRFLLAAIFFVHGLIHFLGAASVLQPGSVPGLSGRALVELPPLFAGVGWAVAGGLFTAAAVSMVLGQGEWWRVGAVALVVSQVMIILSWPEAKAGTIVNVAALLIIGLGAARERFEVKGEDAVAALLAHVSELEGPVVTAEEVQQLPPPVSRWLEASGVVGRPRAAVVRLQQDGQLRPSPGAAWMPITATQHFSIEDPGFVWRVHAKLAKTLPVVGRDLFADGHGQMNITVGGLVPLARAQDEHIDESALLRWLAEVVWFPSAALSPRVRWTAVDARRARAAMRLGASEVEAVFTFDEQGRFQSLEAQRFFGGGPEAKRERWLVSATAWRRFDGVQVPSEGEVVWRLADGDFPAFQWRVTALETGAAAWQAPGAAPVDERWTPHDEAHPSS